MNRIVLWTHHSQRIPDLEEQPNLFLIYLRYRKDIMFVAAADYKLFCYRT